MNSRLASLTLSTLGGVATLLMAGFAQAANVGYYTGCYLPGSEKAPLISQAGQTPVAVASLTPAALAPLQTLIIENCNGGSLASQVTADVKTAVANGMTLVVYDWNPGGSTAAALPGAPAATIVSGSGSQIDLVPGAPTNTGPGGTLTDASMDGGDASNHGFATAIPAGAQAYLTTSNHSQIVSFSYATGAGRVVYSAIPFDCYLGACNAATAPGMKAYFVNVLNPGGSSFTTCAAEGFTGAKLTLCRQICEIRQSPATLSNLIKLYMAIYRQEPPCAR